MFRRLLAPTVAATALFALFVAPMPATAEQPTQVREVFAPDGSISRVTVPVVDQPAAPPASVVAEVIPIQETGPSDERFDLVFVGDGYTADQIATYHEHVVNRWNELIQVEPFRELKDLFNVWQVNVTSKQSGVDNDPQQGVDKDTALDMGFWCGGTERLLCVNETKAQQFADLARDVDQVVALGNSTKYGGAGGTVATSSGGNEQAGQIVPHELGHSVGDLADEYDYPNDTYDGPEPREVNVSTYDADTMADREAKWHTYLGKDSPDGGKIGTYEGAYYHKHGVYRPTENSLMRSLGRPFNLVGLDVMRAAIKNKTR